MSYRRSSIWLAAAMAAVFAVGCKKKVATAPPAAPSPIVLPKPEPPRDPTLPPAPKLETKPPEQPPVSVEIKPPAPKPVPQKKQKAAARKKVEVKPPVEPKLEPPPPEPAVPAAPAVTPRLGQILTPAEARELQGQLQASLDRVKKALVVIEARLLTNDQRETVSRIKTFAAQAEQAKEHDLVSAANLADRADLLSRDLIGRLR